MLYVCVHLASRDSPWQILLAAAEERDYRNKGQVCSYTVCHSSLVQGLSCTTLAGRWTSTIRELNGECCSTRLLGLCPLFGNTGAACRRRRRARAARAGARAGARHRSARPTLSCCALLARAHLARRAPTLFFIIGWSPSANAQADASSMSQERALPRLPHARSALLIMASSLKAGAAQVFQMRKLDSGRKG